MLLAKCICSVSKLMSERASGTFTTTDKVPELVLIAYGIPR